MKYTQRLKLPQYDQTDPADLTAGHNKAMEIIEKYYGTALPCYVLADGEKGALPDGSTTPCLIYVPAKGEVWYDGGEGKRTKPLATASEVSALRDSVSQALSKRVVTNQAVTSANVGVIIRENNPQVMTLEVQSSLGSYTLMVTKNGLGLWDGVASKSLWYISAS